MVERLGWTLVHFLWQGALIAAVYGIARWAARRWSANARYALAATAMAMMALAPAATWISLGPQAEERVLASFQAPLSAASMPGVRDVPARVLEVGEAPASRPVLSWIVGVWFLGASVFSLRLLLAWIAARSLANRPAPPEWQERLRQMQGRIGISRRIRLAIASRADTPAVVGWLRPVVLTPVGALAGLPTEQVEALLFHELAHIRRHDYLVNLAQSVVEALLFYHPAVWWVSAQMRTERELCCDDLAVAMTGDPVTYARALAGVASAARPAFSPAMAATGGALTHRVARLLGQSRPAPRSTPGAGAAGAIAVVATAVALFAQPVEKPKFEAASVKPSATTTFQMVRPQPGRLTADASLKVILLNAYTLAPFQVTGLPPWAEEERFQIEAKASGNATREQLFLMLQSLLEERFQLRVHRETKEMPVLELVAAKSGLKLGAPKEGSCTPPPTDAPNGFAGSGRMQPPTGGPPPRPYCGNMVVRLAPDGAQLAGGQVRMGELARMLSMAMGRAVIDRTGYTEPFDAQVDFMPDQATPSLPPPPPGSPLPENGRPTITTAIQEQLGVRLQSGKGPVDTLVVDRVERPSAN